MSFSALLGQYASQKGQPTPQEKVIKEPLSYRTIRNVESKLNSLTSVNGTASTDPKLCVLFIIIDKFPFEHIWRLWLSRSPSKVDMYFHAKYPEKVTSKWVKERLVNQFHYLPSWGSVDIAKVMIYMLKEASDKCPLATNFVFASESCIPIVSVESVLKAVNESDVKSSWVNWHDKSQCNGYSVGPQFEAMTASVPPEYIFKADQWCMLSRSHTEQILAYKEAFDAEHLRLTNYHGGFTYLFNPGKATDELIIPCSLALLGHIKGKNIGAGEGRVLVRRSTYCDWSAREKRPRSFTPTDVSLVPAEHLKAAQVEGCIFLRKIALPEGTDNVNENMLRHWLTIVEDGEDESDFSSEDKVQNALARIEEFKQSDTALEVKDTRHLAGVFNNFERNSHVGSRDGKPHGGVGKWESNRGSSDNKRKHEGGYEGNSSRSWQKPYYDHDRR